MTDEIFRSPKKRGRIMVLLSGRGSNFMAIHDAIRGRPNRRRDRPRLQQQGGRPGARRPPASAGSKRCTSIPSSIPDKEEYDERSSGKPEAGDRPDLPRRLHEGPDPGILQRSIKNRILNIHPALLPSFPGLHVQQKAIDWGVRFSGCTVHFVAAEVDMGPIILQAAVPVLQDDTEETLAARILVEEHKIYPEAVKLFFEGRIEVRGRRVFIRE